MAGLSQLHQLRGRVGRGSERAYAYFLYPPERALTETAHERLATVAQHTEVGAGMYVALKDLEIRGAGNLLGGEQSGHIAGVGFDLYVRMIGEAVNELKGDGPAEKPVAGQHIRFAPVELPDSRQVRVQRLYPKTVLKSAVHAMLVPAPRTPRGGQSPRDTAVGGKPLQDRELLAWCGEVIRSVLADR